MFRMTMETSNSTTTKWVSAPPNYAVKEWFVGIFGLATAAIIILALVTNATAFVITLILTLGAVCFLVYRQIDQMNEAARTLYESEERFRLLVAEVRDYAIFGLSPDGRVMSWNSGAQRMTGYSPDEIVGKPFSMLWDPSGSGTGSHAQRLLLNATQEGRVQIEASVRRKDSTNFMVSTVVTPLAGESNTLRGFSVIASDITAKKKAEEALLTSHRFIQRVTSTLPDILFTYDMHDDIAAFINDEARTILRHSEEALKELAHKPLQRLVHPDDRACFSSLKENSASLRDGEVLVFEARLADASGEWRWFSLRAVVFARAADGMPSQMLFLAQDMTQLKRAQEDMKRFEQAALSRERLALLGELSASVAHEFRNPLLGVQHCVEELRARCRDTELTELVDLLSEGLSRMDHVSSRLLRLARNDEGTRALSDVAQCIEGTCAFVRSHAQRAGVRLHMSIEPNMPPVPLNAERLSEALLNLIYNSIDACEPNDSVTVSARQRVEANKLEICVSDTGSGIPSDLKEKIFEAFFTTKASGRGTGLGMTIVRRIIEAHRGNIELLDQDSKGSTFRILLPLSTAPETDKENAQ
jgi:PAS domain S-box-containing protein